VVKNIQKEINNLRATLAVLQSEKSDYMNANVRKSMISSIQVELKDYFFKLNMIRGNCN